MPLWFNLSRASRGREPCRRQNACSPRFKPTIVVRVRATLGQQATTPCWPYPLRGEYFSEPKVTPDAIIVAPALLALKNIRPAAGMASTG